MEALAEQEPRRAKVIELRYFGGLSVEETAEALGVSPQTVMRDWKLARAWLAVELRNRWAVGALPRVRRGSPRADALNWLVKEPMPRFAVLLSLLLTASSLLLGQSHPPFQDDFPAEEFVQRRARVFDAIGQDALAIVQGAAGVDGFKVFRQSNEFYYLTGLESPHAYLVLDGRSRKATLYLAHRNEALERSTGARWSAEDAADVQRLTGVEAVAPSNSCRIRPSARCSGRRARCSTCRSARPKARRRAATNCSRTRPAWPAIRGTGGRRARRTSWASWPIATRHSNDGT